MIPEIEKNKAARCRGSQRAVLLIPKCLIFYGVGAGMTKKTGGNFLIIIYWPGETLLNSSNGDNVPLL
jgi:hypothetical protein